MAVRAVLRGLVASCATAASLVALASGTSSAQLFPTTDAPAGYIVFPKVVADTHASPALDTVIQITNTNPTFARSLHCFYVNPSDCHGDNFDIPLTRGAPFAWSVSQGSSSPRIPGRDPFVGEIKCFESNGDLLNPVPVNANDIVGEATIYTVASGTPGSVDVRSYNGIGFQTTVVSPLEPPAAQPNRCTSGPNAGATCTDDNQCTPSSCGVLMCLGANPGSGAQCTVPNYPGCPSTLILNNFFDDASDPATGDPITTRLTLVSCTEDTSGVNEPLNSVQFLLFNEFEQRLSTSTRFSCFRDSNLSNIDSKIGAENASVFNVGTQGTLVGQTRIRGVTTGETNVGHGIIGIAEEFHGTASVAVNLNQSAVTAGQADFVRIP
jgi:hypothetical protein